jgi:hypothetical protein
MAITADFLVAMDTTYLLTDNERTVTTGHVAGLAVRNRQMLSVAHYYGASLHTCAPADPESKGGSESTVKLAKADVLPRPENLVGDYADFSGLETACAEATDRFNTRLHRETDARPTDRLAIEAAQLHPVPTEPYTSVFGVTRSVSWSSIVCFGGARYSVPHQLAGTIVFVQRVGDDIVVVSPGTDGPREVARHRAAGRGQLVVLDEHYPERRSTPERAPRATNPREADFLALGVGARRYLAELCANGVRGIPDRMDEALALAAFGDVGRVDEALGICALAGRFSAGDLASVLAAGPQATLHRPGESHSLQPGTRGWEGFGR